MSQRSWTVGALASRANLDPERALVALWAAGIEYVESPASRILKADSRTAQKAVGIGGIQQRRVAYWLNEYDLERNELAELLQVLGFSLKANASSMPEGSIKRLNTYMRSGRDKTAMRLEQRREEKKSEMKPAAEPFEWSAKGTVRPSMFLTAEEVLGIHEELERDFAEAADPISPPGVRSVALLESAVSRPATSMGGQYKYSTIQSAGAALLHSLVQNHAFYNGNKRTALVSLLVFLDRNNFVLDSTEGELFKWMLRVASHDLLPAGFSYDNVADRETAAITDWVCRHSRAASKEERSVTWRELNKLLRMKDCEILQHRGEKLKITRTVVEKRRLPPFKKTRTLDTYFTNTGDGREVPKAKIKTIRHELELDEEHGVDSQMFYSARREPDFFIIKYSKLLSKLSKV
ncbi:type II toxin-antitoxin system death-on-curing family toxin [Arthrobacter sp. CAL618]|uniref:type II toxin-antitoxin system death-on-curing family toxin n=1 Tax=Arthrobacter sp. CAL618 TaxID=1055770 RepID=UPI0004163BAA|nr:type II toxin-antitoxin system death-on-curing family toxin [Arthrobacter sp. CAL618]